MIEKKFPELSLDALQIRSTLKTEHSIGLKICVLIVFDGVTLLFLNALQHTFDIDAVHSRCIR